LHNLFEAEICPPAQTESLGLRPFSIPLSHDILTRPLAEPGQVGLWGNVPTGINYFVPIDDALRFLSAEPQ